MLGLPNITDWRIDLAAPARSILMRNGRAYPVRPGSTEESTAKAIAVAIHAQPAAIATRCAVEVDGVTYRVEQMPSRIVAVRAIPDTVPTLEDLGIARPYRDLMLDPGLGRMGGFVIICGAAGSGKSHTAAALTAAYLREGHIDYALTYENPIEFQMAGFHGAGYLDQNSIPEGNYAHALSHCLRCFPAKARSLLFVGEILDADAAVEVCKIFMTGHLVLTTLHGSDIIGALQRLCALSGADTTRAIREVIATSLRLIVHQELVRTTEGVRVRMQALRVSASAQQLIAQGMLQNLRDPIAVTQGSILRDPKT